PAALEFPFLLSVGGQLVRGRIDAAYTAPSIVPAGHDVLIVDWKTGRSQPDRLQLGLYRLAWAELHGLRLERVAAAFHHVRTDRLEIVEGLPDRSAIEGLMRRLGGR
ncbi:MAG TPA: PD-(D/E)XK nuclease family protein, partial [Propionibacteriaceae bacterium]|nr:PD-(D/E)XK nuclease family protein [Propionibacteriaceae bacterium]